MSILYTVKSGDTLTAIAKTYLGDAKRFTEILDEHQHVIKDQNKIKVNQLLMLPNDADGVPSGCVDDPTSMAAFDAGYNPRYRAVEGAYPPEVSFLVDHLLNYCDASNDAAFAWLTSPKSQLSPAVRSKIISSQDSWQQFLDGSGDAMQTLIDPIIRNYLNDSGFRQPDALITATLLRARYMQLNRLIAVQMGILADERSDMVNAQG